MTQSANKNLYLPDKADTGVEVVSSLKDNFVKIDTELQKNTDDLNAHKTALAAHTSENIAYTDGSVKDALDSHDSRITQNTDNINTLVLPPISDLSTRMGDAEANIGLLSEEIDNTTSLASGTFKTNISIYRSTNLSLNSGVDTKVLFTAITRDTLTEVSVSTSEITLQSTGLYLINANAIFSTVLAATSYIRVYKNGSFLVSIVAGTGQLSLYGSKLNQFSAGDKLTFYVLQNSGTTATLTSALIDVVRIF